MKLRPQIISYVLNPLLMLLILPYLLILKTTNNEQTALIWTLYTLIFLAALAIYILYEVKRGVFSDLDISRRDQRPPLFHLALFLTVVYLVGLYFFAAPRILYVLALGMLIGICAVSIINRRIKASIHVGTIASLLVAVAMIYKGYYFLLLLLIPLVGWARVQIKKHTIPEVLVGGVLGSLLSLIMYALVKLVIKL